MTPRRTLIVLSTTLACAYTLLAPTAAPSLGTIECAAPPYFDAVADAMSPGEPDNGKDIGMSLLRQQAGQALAQLQTRTAGNQ
jgi:hypothetical protein